MEDPAESRLVPVKLFGKTILVPLQRDLPAAGHAEEDGCGGAVSLGGVEEDTKESPSLEQRYELQATSSSLASQVAPPAENLKQEEEQGVPLPQEKQTIKKPDKVLACPRCHSMDTKFCYYNNYNLAQPRHFCRACQRYWTAGGAIRNLPVGAGRRKSKHSATNYRQVTIFDASFHSVHPQPLTKPAGAVLRFGSSMPTPYDSMVSALKLPEKTMGGEQHVAPYFGRLGAVENGDEHSSGSSATASKNAVDRCGTGPLERAPQDSRENPPEDPSFNGSPWPYLWTCANPFYPSCFPISFNPTVAYRGCALGWPAPPSSSPSLGFAPLQPALTKHLREDDVLTQEDGEGRPRLPKTLRIDDPEVVAKSSVWAAMALKGDKAGGISKGGLFMPFDQPKPETAKPSMETPVVLHANPAALSRSLNFHESFS